MRIEDALKTNKFRDEAHKAILNILYSAYCLNNNLNQLIKPFGITQEQFNVMRILRGSLPLHLCVRDIGSRMIEKSSNVPRILDRLAKKGYIVRIQSEIDKRETAIVISQKALDLLHQIDGIVAEGERKFLCLSEEEAKTLNELLEKIREGEVS